MRIEPINADHAGWAAAIAARAIRATEGAPYSAAQVQVWLSGMTETRFRSLLSEQVAFGAFDGDKLVGFATFVPANTRLDFLYVDPGVWRRGVAGRLVAEVEAHARSIGCPRIEVDASRLLRPALLRMGYEVESENTKVRDGVTFDNVWLSKQL